MAAARIRRTFRFSDDTEHEENEREELDDEEQERLIQELQVKNEEQNSFYNLAFIILPLVAMIAFVPPVVSSSTAASQRVTCAASILSLASTAYLMASDEIGSKTDQGHLLKPLPVMAHLNASMAPVGKRYLLPINVGLCVFLSLISLSSMSSTGNDKQPWPGLYLVPGAVFGIVYVAHRTMLDVDIGQLKKLRYEYKGA